MRSINSFSQDELRATADGLSELRGENEANKANELTLTREQFEKGVIGQSDNHDYSESGYVAVKLPDGRYAITHYSHCSCYETFDALCNGSPGDTYDSGLARFDWIGAKTDLIEMAKRVADPALPNRNALLGDQDYHHLVSVYTAVLVKFGFDHFGFEVAEPSPSSAMKADADEMGLSVEAFLAGLHRMWRAFKNEQEAK